ncbi:SMP-30/gluconolactonase/LRE family protein [Shumkonia mesophila]|uniref:SMP-30/gluconolactonase/LRE family protein n=1 Tax=Shumkonia mesophila TaxID=2838854 RepID=UPI002934B736|nr:SMP-30/gluconolactonase/LRE family protein [Shumkonia mesophila]
MFQVPPSVEAKIFARLPDKFRNPKKRSRWIEIRRRGVDTHSFFEGPSFDRDGNLYVVDLAYSRIFRISPNRTFTLIADYDGEPNGLKIHRDGRIFVADHRLGLLQLDPDTGSLNPILERAFLESFKGLNDLIFDKDGTLYFTDQGETGMNDPTGRVYRRFPDGRLQLLLNNVPSPNGIALSPDETLLYVAATRGNCIWRVPIETTGEVSRAGIFIQLSGGLAGPDGIAVDAKGGLIACINGFGTVWAFSRLGEPQLRIHSPEGLATTNCAFGGPDNKTLFITESSSGSILAVDMEVPGLPLFSHA